eukprot:CAMPEP_0175144976 /NCGR_PEP_ID=MMETSP0087-20121206/14479_1 /TAXON_ID=136419 /ORGANISM="Unknown Unknown, Strain D1" /LENGTH=467 /DNA_ID=CAMNT_0016429601 /DNA_START=328 /DNA_END=1731 /DNA_ORIENTATION=-
MKCSQSQKCPLGQSCDPSGTCVGQLAKCGEQLKTCEDGSKVKRSPMYDCNFEPCPKTGGKSTLPPTAAVQALNDLSCVGQCNVVKSGCSCDAMCSGFNDCCSDYVAVCGEQEAVSQVSVSSKVETCQGKCGGQSLGTCWCTENCNFYGDCCTDYKILCVTAVAPTELPSVAITAVASGTATATLTVTEAVGSCKGACGKQGSGMCFCDTACKQHGDCCRDFSSECAPTPTVPPTAPPTPNFNALISSPGALKEILTPSDHVEKSDSCFGKCFQNAGDCYCDQNCVVNGDCCKNVFRMCPVSANPLLGSLESQYPQEYLPSPTQAAPALVVVAPTTAKPIPTLSAPEPTKKPVVPSVESILANIPVAKPTPKPSSSPTLSSSSSSSTSVFDQKNPPCGPCLARGGYWFNNKCTPHCDETNWTFGDCYNVVVHPSQCPPEDYGGMPMPVSVPAPGRRLLQASLGVDRSA